MIASILPSSQSNLPCIEFTPNKLKLCISDKKKGRVVISRLAEFRVEGEGFDSAVERFKAFLNEKKIILKECYALISTHSVAVRFLKLPSKDSREIENMLSWQVAKQLPYQPDEIIYSYHIVHVDSLGFSHVMIFIAHKDLVNRCLQALNTLSVRPLALTLSCEALQLFYNLKSSADAGRRQENAALIEVNPYSVSVAISSRGNLHFVRGTSIQQSSGLAERAADEAALSFETYKKLEFARRIERVVISASSQIAFAALEAFKARFSEPVEVFDCRDGFDMDKSAVVTEDEQYNSIIGLALAQAGAQINLLPKEIIRAVYSYRLKFQVMRTVLLAVIVLALTAGVGLKKIHERKKYLDALNVELHTLGEDTIKLDEKAKRLEMVSKQTQKESRILDSMSEIYKSAPQDITLSSVLYEQEKGVNIRGNAKTMSSVFGFVSSMESSQFFAGVQMGYVTKKKDASGESVDFEIVAPFEAK